VHTTLDLRHQEAAEKFMSEGLERANREYIRSRGRSNAQAERIYIPIINLLTLAFDITDIRSAAAGQNETKALSRYTRTINPIVDLAALAFGIPELKDATSKGFADLKVNTEQNVVEGALISIENETGYITAIVGGSKYDESNQLIRATQGNTQPGSSFKPLYYSAAIDSRKLTAASLIYDVPIVFHNEDGTPYIPLNFRGEWKGSVLLYDALAHSMNVPSLKVLDTIGFDLAIERAAALLDITDPAQIRRTFPRVYPLGLGIISSSPLRMARAFAVFGNEGRNVTPIAIRAVEDRNGRVVLDVERDVRQRQRRMGNGIQVVSPQNAYIMTKIMEKTVTEGTLAYGSGVGSKLAYKDEKGNTFRIPLAGKTGTPQNWSDAWAVGYSPYYTTAIWFGFDKPGNSLGVELTGSTLAGPIWGDYMREIHKGKSRREFARPASGIIDVTVCAKSGLLRTADCNEGVVTLPFLTGTQPGQYCDLHGGSSPYQSRIPVRSAQYGAYDDDFLFNSLAMPTLPLDLLPELADNPNRNSQSGSRNNRNNANRNTPSSLFLSNPFLDDDVDIIPNLQVEPEETREMLEEAPVEIKETAHNAAHETAIGPIVPVVELELEEPVQEAIDADTADDALPSWNPLE
ncbi:MAG: penicillin-binding protein, partial [Treponema sp.]|jgi:penicillin-binding protein 1A|nr:penicillin-binding protein [Treponema sp.]